jgi:hypothetical protein
VSFERAETGSNIASATPVPMSRIWRTIRGYILWSYDRGTLQYDVMVTLILLFVFLSPLCINFRDKPVEHNPHQTGVVFIPDGQGGFICEIEAGAVQAKDAASIHSELLSIIEPISGEVTISKYEAIRDQSGHMLRYKVWVQR